MAFHERQYIAYVLLGNETAEPLWSWPRWVEFTGAFDPVVNLCRDKAAVRCTQFSGEPRKPVKFGRLSWSPEAHQKWTHESPITGATSRVWSFLSVEVSAPSLSISAAQGTPPDFNLVVRNESALFRKTQLAFNPVIFVAIAADLSPEVLAHCRIAVEKAETMVGSRLSAATVLPWGHAFGSSGGFTRTIQDIVTTGLFKIGPAHTRPVDLETLDGEWKRFG